MRNIFVCSCLLLASCFSASFAAASDAAAVVTAVVVKSKVAAPKAEKSEKGYQFTVEVEVPATSVKDQASSGTCWSFATMSFLESELLRRGKGEHDLSDMWASRHAYFEKAVRYARMHGAMTLAAGGWGNDVLNIIDKYGVVPEEVYSGLNYGTDKHRHGEIDATIKAYMDAIIANPNKQLSTAWKAGLNGILDAYYGAVPESFVCQGVTYTPRSFADSLGIRGADYESVTSFTHHGLGERFALEVPDNWNNNTSVNVPLDSLASIVDRAVRGGVSVMWFADVSEPGFSYNKGIAVLPATNANDMSDSEKAKWSELTPEERNASARKFLDGPVSEVVVNAQNRQAGFDDYTTTDDHVMQITGIGHDQNGKKYYKVKNSWGPSGVYDGYLWVSEPFFRAKTMNLLLPASCFVPVV